MSHETAFQSVEYLPWHFRFDSLSELASQALANDLAPLLGIGDCLALQGDLGLGKGTLARALIRARGNDPFLEVPSPTFTLVQGYEFEELEISHFDLYRISDFEELYEIGFEESWQNGCALVEWPDRGEELLPADTLWLNFEVGSQDDTRCLTLSGTEEWGERLQRILEKRLLLIESGWGDALRHPIAGDLSPRTYDRVFPATDDIQTNDTISRPASAILMDMPERVPGPQLADGRLYDLVAHRVTKLAPMISIREGLAGMGLRVPNVYGVSIEKGLMLWEDFGKNTLAEGPEAPVTDRYLATVSALARLHAQPTPGIFDGEGGEHVLSCYDSPAFMVELDVFLDFYWPHIKGSPCPASERESFKTLWSTLIDRLSGYEQALVLRDVQDPNCFWLDDAEENEKVGFIDFQDCMIGPAAYDLCAIAMDARVTISPALRDEMLDHYCSQRGLDTQARDDFMAAFCICGAQRISKNLGAFARAADQAGRKDYLNHIPRSLAYLSNVVEHSLLSDLKDWYSSRDLL